MKLARLNEVGSLCSLQLSSSPTPTIFMKQFASVSSVIMYLLFLFCKVLLLLLISLVSLSSCTRPCSSCVSFKVVLDLPNAHICPCIMLRLISFLLLGPGHVIRTHISTSFQFISLVGTMSRRYCTV